MSVAHPAIAPDLGDGVGGSDAAAADWYDVEPLVEDGRVLAFDHVEILEEGVNRARNKLEYSPLATDFCPPEFTIGDLRRVYEVIWASASTRRTSTAKCGTPKGSSSRRPGRLSDGEAGPLSSTDGVRRSGSIRR